ncbi:hypothetical protein [Ectobacillus panaciterrae]|uniref:hypothetical protein n=1 Tax=Ectobacillus panaciterrae TaxID=363872 RepID=UPI00041381C6|nr:hypothetical protein [Ectobacillus panaciterrae]
MTLIANSISVVGGQELEQDSPEAQAIQLLFGYGDKIIDIINSMPPSEVEIEVFMQDDITFVQGDNYTAVISKAGDILHANLGDY